jgi:hypothetical protein
LGEVKTPPFWLRRAWRPACFCGDSSQGIAEFLTTSNAADREKVSRVAHCRREDVAIVYRLDHDAVVILAVFRKATPKTPGRISRTYDVGYASMTR